MVKIGEVACPKCGEDRETLVSEVIDLMGQRYFCSVCAHEFRPSEKSKAVALTNSTDRRSI